MKSMAKSGIEKEYIQAMCEDTYKIAIADAAERRGGSVLAGSG